MVIKLYIKTEVMKNIHETARIGIAPVKTFKDEILVEVVSGIRSVYYELPPSFGVESITLVRDSDFSDKFTLIICRKEDNDSANWFLDCVCLDVILEPHELAWFE